MWRNDSRAVYELAFEIFRVNGRLLATGDALMSDLGLTSARWQVLGAIAMSPAPLTVAQIARNIGAARQSVQRLTNDMGSSGLVELRENPHHKRARVVHLTPAGREAYDTAVQRWEEWADALEEVFASESEIAETIARLRRVRALLQAKARAALLAVR